MPDVRGGSVRTALARVRARARAAIAGGGGAGAGDAAALPALRICGPTSWRVSRSAPSRCRRLWRWRSSPACPSSSGLYGTFLPLAVYGLLGTSRQHVVGPDSTLAALTAVTVAPMAMVGGEVDPARYVALAAALALAMGVLLFLAGLFRLGFVGGLLRQAGAARLHQRRRADRDRVPVRQAPRDQRRRGRLLPDRREVAVGARRRERADRAV